MQNHSFAYHAGYRRPEMRKQAQKKSAQTQEPQIGRCAAPVSVPIFQGRTDFPRCAPPFQFWRAVFRSGVRV